MHLSRRCALGVCLTLTFAGCGGAGSAPSSPSVAGPNVRPAYGVIYSFKGYPSDGQEPYSGINYANGTLYGTTEYGGTSNNGTTFALAAGSGLETNLYSFGGLGSGAYPTAGVNILNGAVYGTTLKGGTGYGTIFTISPSSKGPTTIYPFKGGYDGVNPTADLAFIKSTNSFYSTTESGGAYGKGTVFEVTPSGSESILYSFGAGSGDGATPTSGLFKSGGTFYGTTEWGGSYNKGTLYSISVTGKESVLYSFGKTGTTDGEFPRAGVFGKNGVFYGTTEDGGNCSKGAGKGTVYKFSQHTGKESIIHSFCGKPDGAYPFAGIADVNGVFYGTTSGGGTHGGGTVFEIASGSETVLHDFPQYSGDGEGPMRKLNYINGLLYGTTRSGGSGDCPPRGCGTVFAIAP